MRQAFKKRPWNEIVSRYFVTSLEDNILMKDISHIFSKENKIVYNINRTFAFAIKINVLFSQRYLSKIKTFSKNQRDILLKIDIIKSQS